MKKIIFSDLDGTLLNHDDYSYQEAENGLKLLKNNKIPLILCSSKTRVEIEFWKKKFNNVHPFISENGGAVFIPNKYFSFEYSIDLLKDNYKIIELGRSIKELKKVIDIIKSEGFKIKSFNDMTLEEISDDSGLDIKQSDFAKQREYDLPFIILKEEQKNLILKKIRDLNYKITKGGRYYHIIRDNDKGKAVDILIKLFKKQFGSIQSFGIGDSENDFPMLDRVDKGFLVKKRDGSYSSDKYHHAKGIGPVGWNEIIEIII